MMLKKELHFGNYSLLRIFLSFFFISFLVLSFFSSLFFSFCTYRTNTVGCMHKCFSTRITSFIFFHFFFFSKYVICFLFHSLSEFQFNFNFFIRNKVIFSLNLLTLTRSAASSMLASRWCYLRPSPTNAHFEKTFISSQANYFSVRFYIWRDLLLLLLAWILSFRFQCPIRSHRNFTQLKWVSF